MTRPGDETTVTLLARRTTHYLYVRRLRARGQPEPEIPFPGLHESLAVHLAAILPAWLLARVSLPTYLAWTDRLSRLLATASRTAVGLRDAVRPAPGRSAGDRPRPAPGAEVPPWSRER